MYRTFRRKFAELDRLMDLTEKINEGHVLDEILDHLFESFDDLIPYDRIGCALISEDGRSCHSVWNRSRAPKMHLSVGYSAPLEGSSLMSLLDSGRPRILNDLQSYLRDHPTSENTRAILAEGIRSSLTCPLVASGKPVGFLFFSSMKPNTYAEVHSEIYLRIAQHLSWTIEKGHFYEELLAIKYDLEVRNRFIEQVFGRYLSDEVVHQLLHTPKGLELGGEERTVTLLMADLRGFSALLSTMLPHQAVRLLNNYLGAMANVISDHGGTINEFLGDCVFAMFGAPMSVSTRDDALRAAACAISMQLEMEQVNRVFEEEGLPSLEIGIALHTGKVVVGNVGCERRAKYGVVGNAVNLVSRLEARAGGRQVLASEDTLRELGDEAELGFRREVSVKGFRGPLKASELIGLKGGPKSASRVREEPLVPVRKPVPVGYRRVVEKHLGEDCEGTLVRVCSDRAEIRPAAPQCCANCGREFPPICPAIPLEPTDDIEISFGLPGEHDASKPIYATVTDVVTEPVPCFTVAFTGMGSAARAVVKGLVNA